MAALVLQKHQSKLGGTKAYEHYSSLLPRYGNVLKELELEPFSGGSSVPFFMQV